MELRRFLDGDVAQTVSVRGICLFALLLVVAVAVRAQTFGNPVIGFDEQYYLVVGTRMWDGAVPFVDLFDRKPVGLFLIYAAIAALPVDATLAYQGVAVMFVTTTAWLIATFPISARLRGGDCVDNARASHGGRGLLLHDGRWLAAIAYLLWLNFLEGEGGQAPVFYNLPIVAAAAIVARAVGRRRASLGEGTATMLLVGTALQIKYSVVFEGVFFGTALLWSAWRGGARLTALTVRAVVWIAAALLPTALAGAAYARMGHLDAWIFANFVSTFGKLADPAATSVAGLATIVGILLPLALFAGDARRDFVLGWLAAAAFGMIAFGAFGSPHYALPVLVPLTVAAARGLVRWRRAGWAVLALGLVGGQAVLTITRYAKGDAATARAVAAAAQPRSGGCLYVYDGYPALYRLVRTCMPTRYAFPGHLNTANEASARGLGVDPSQEVVRILATRPEVIVVDLPLFQRGNRATWALVLAALRDYRIAADVVTGAARHRQVWRRAGS